MSHVLLILVIHIVVSANGFFNSFPEVTERLNDDGVDPGEPLFLTPYIESGNMEEARNLSYVDFPGFPKTKSYAGFFTVDKTYNSNQFLWYFPAEIATNKSAVYLWLQGSPGLSSLFGLFNENGPLKVNDSKFQLRDLSWAHTEHVIYVDNPVGTGFSFTNDSRGYCTDLTQIGEHLYAALTQFFQLFPELQKHDFFISGEAYAGKYIPALAYTIHKKNPTAKVKINLKGLMIGNGWCDPVNQIGYSDYLYQLGLINEKQKNIAKYKQNIVIDYINMDAWRDAYDEYKRLFEFFKFCFKHVSIFNYIPVYHYDYNILLKRKEVIDYSRLIQDGAVRKAIHVGNLTFGHGSEVYESLVEDTMKSVAPWISELLEYYSILFYNGQGDVIVPYPQTVNFLRKLNFSGREDYLRAQRSYIFVYEPLIDDSSYILSSYLRQGGKLTDALIRVAGHMVPADQSTFMNALMIIWRNIIE